MTTYSEALAGFTFGLAKTAAIGTLMVSTGVLGYAHSHGMPLRQGTIEIAIESAVANVGLDAIKAILNIAKSANEASSGYGVSERVAETVSGGILGLGVGGLFGAIESAVEGAIGYGIGYGIGMMTR